MTIAKRTFIETLKRAGYSTTRARTCVFDLLDGSEAITMHELSQLAGKTVDRASLYRNIELFEKLGIVQRLRIGWKYKIELSDTYSHHHHHITCLGCQRVTVIDEHGAIEALINDIAKHATMTAASHQLEIQGYCANCVPAAKQ